MTRIAPGEPIAVEYSCGHVGIEEVWGGEKAEQIRRQHMLGRLCPPCAREVVRRNAAQDKKEREITTHTGHSKRSYSWLASECRACFDKKAKRGLRNPDGFIRQAALDAMEKYGQS